MALYEKDNYGFAENSDMCLKNPETEIIHMENQKEKKNKFYEKGGWLFTSYPVIMVFLYVVLGACFGNAGWITGWLVFLTIPLFYTGVIAVKKKKPIIFCYPVLATMIYLMLGFFAGLWHPMWIIFLTIPIFYCVCAAIKKN